jgi:Spy/CpxP family protein refolding chaperone
MKLTVCAALAAACAMLSVLPVSAQEAQSPGQACKADREKFCSGMKPGDGKMRDCMKQHASELSAECTSAMKAAREAFRNIRQECKADAEKFCSDTPKAGGGVMKCLESHASELEAACSTALSARPGKKA